MTVHQHVQPGTTTWGIALADTSNGRMVAVSIEHTTGSSVYFIDPDTAKALAAHLEQAGTQARSGLILPHNGKASIPMPTVTVTDD